MDVHVRFPGIQIEPDRAFDYLWQERRTQTIASRECTVPSVEAQRLILLLHAARNLESRATDIEVAWSNSSHEDLLSVKALARELNAVVALGAATGRLDEYRDHREYDLWRSYADGAVTTSISAHVAAVAKAAPAGAKRLHHRVLQHLLSIIEGRASRLGVALGREPTRAEVLGAYGRMLHRAAQEVWVLARRRFVHGPKFRA